MNSNIQEQPLEVARCWARELGSSESSLVRLQGGINNHVFSCGDGCQKWVIKSYRPLQNEQRDQMRAEVDFLRYASLAAPGFTPKLFHEDYKQRCVVLEHLEGEPFPQGVAPSEEAVDAAVEFFRRLNAEPESAKVNIGLDATESFLSLSAHLKNIHQRLVGMGYDHLPKEVMPKAKRLLVKLRSDLERIREITFRRIACGELADEISPKARCVSPSDFGFHNAICTTTGVRFYDFEYAGWDDPAKTAVDFVLQPRIPIKTKSSPLLRSLRLDQCVNINKRYQAIGPIMELKWHCIILSVLNPSRLSSILETNKALHAGNLISQRLHSATTRLIKNRRLFEIN